MERVERLAEGSFCCYFEHLDSARVFRLTSKPTDKIIREALSLGHYLTSYGRTTSERSDPIRVTWNAQNFSGVILHVDGRSMGNPDTTGFGVVLRTNAITPLDKGSLRLLGQAGNVKAELFALYKCLQLAWDSGYSDIEG